VRVTRLSPTDAQADDTDPPAITDQPAPADAAGTTDPAGPTATEPVDGGRDTGHVAAPGRRRAALVDLGVCAALLAAGIAVGHGLLAHPATRALALNPNDQALVEWFLALGTRIWAGDLHLVTHLLNAPDGVNLLSNASLLTLGVLLSPVTLAFGAPVAFAVGVAGNLAGTAVAWYLLLRHTVRLHPAAAAVGALFCGYAPGMISQANAHLHITAQWLVPVIVWTVLRLARADLRRAVPIAGLGLLLGVVIAAQLFLGEEVLFLTAIGLALFCLTYLPIAGRPALRALLPVGFGLAIAAGTAVMLLGYPLWVQFAGPQHTPNGPFAPAFFGADLAGYWSLSPLSWFGSTGTAKLASGPAEYNTFLGVPLLVVAAAGTVWLWRRPAVLAATMTGAAAAAFALGPTVAVDGTPTPHTGPYQLISGLPVIDGALPTRFALILIPVIAFVLATGVDRALRDGQPTTRLVVPLVVALGLLPLVPRPLPTTGRPAVPRFFTGGDWQRCVRPGGTLVPVPLPSPSNPDKMRWAAAAGARFAVPEGFFIGPYADHGRASLGIYSRPTSGLLNKVEETGAVPEVGATERDQARKDVAYWHASCLVLADRDQANRGPLAATMTALFGIGTHVDDVTVWRVSPT
jgi:hypothetical protein